MYITQIELNNFQQHSHLVLNFVNGVNVLRGKTGLGKSTILKAIGWVFGESINKDSIIPWFEGEPLPTEVQLSFDDGTKIKRILSKLINAYEFYPAGINESIRFDSFGKEIPEQIRDYLQLPIMTIDKEEICLNIQAQHEPHFLLSRPDTFKMKVLNVLTGNDVLDKVAQSFNKDLLALSKENKKLKGDIEIKTKESGILKTFITQQEEKYNIVNELLLQAEKLQTDIDKVGDLIDAKENEITIQEKINTELKDLKIIDLSDIDIYKDLADKINQVNKLLNNKQTILSQHIEITNQIKKLKSIDTSRFEEYKLLADKINKVEDLLNTKTKLKAQIANIKFEIKDYLPLDINIAENLETVEKINKVQELLDKKQNILNKQKDIKSQQDVINKEILALNNKYQELLNKLPEDKCKQCPLIQIKKGA